MQKYGAQDKIWENVHKLEEQSRQFGQMRLKGTDNWVRGHKACHSQVPQTTPWLVTFKLVRVPDWLAV